MFKMSWYAFVLLRNLGIVWPGYRARTQLEWEKGQFWPCPWPESRDHYPEVFCLAGLAAPFLVFGCRSHAAEDLSQTLGISECLSSPLASLQIARSAVKTTNTNKQHSTDFCLFLSETSRPAACFHLWLSLFLVSTMVSWTWQWEKQLYWSFGKWVLMS